MFAAEVLAADSVATASNPEVNCRMRGVVILRESRNG